jgi:hypothetical protein
MIPPVITKVSGNSQLAVESRWQMMLRVVASGKSSGRSPSDYLTFDAIAPIYLRATHTTTPWILGGIRANIPSETVNLSVGRRICLQDKSRIDAVLNPECPTMFCTLDRVLWAEPGYHIYECDVHLYSRDGKFPENSSHHMVAVPEMYVCDEECRPWGRSRSLGQRLSLTERKVLPPLREWETDPSPMTETQLNRREIELREQEIKAWVEKLDTN